tara:strand:+ start:7180 stop:7365 length:186 start_codon:yes stop_codon:yes gene_type:complete
MARIGQGPAVIEAVWLCRVAGSNPPAGSGFESQKYAREIARSNEQYLILDAAEWPQFPRSG